MYFSVCNEFQLQYFFFFFKEILMDLEIAINSFEMPANNQGITKPGRFVKSFYYDYF